jgi:hypothetical protein
MNTIETPEQFRAYVCKLLEKELADTIYQHDPNNYQGDATIGIYLDDDDTTVLLSAINDETITAKATGAGRWMFVRAVCMTAHLDSGAIVLTYSIIPDDTGSQPDVDI